MSPEAEHALMEYLREQKVADVAGSVRGIFEWTQTHAHADELRHAEIVGALRGHSLRIGRLEENDEKIDTRLEKSGSWQIEAEQAKAMAASKSAEWWKDKVTTFVVGVVMLIAGGGLTWLLGRK